MANKRGYRRVSRKCGKERVTGLCGQNEGVKGCQKGVTGSGVLTTEKNEFAASAVFVERLTSRAFISDFEVQCNFTGE